MLTEYREFKLDEGKGDIIARVNWNGSEDVKECRLIEFEIGKLSGKSKKFWIKKDDLVGLLMVLGSPQDIKDLIPMKLTKIKKYETILDFKWKASRNIQKGEEVIVRAPHIVNIPIEQEVMSGALPTKYTHKDGIIKPRGGVYK